MRVLTTWMYFDSSQIKGEKRFRPRGRGEEHEPGIGVAWFAGDTTTMMEISNLKVFHSLPRGGHREDKALSEELLRDTSTCF